MKWDVLFETFQPFQTHHESCLFETFRWDLKKRCYLKLLKLETFQTHVMGGLLIWKFQMRLEKEVLFEMFETWNFSNMSWGVLYLKLSDETWNEMCYLKLFYLFKPITRVAYFKLSDDLKQDMLFEMFETWNFSNMSWGLLIWNFQIRLEVRCAIWNFSKFSNPSQELVIWNFQMRLEKEVLFETFQTFQTHHGGVAYLGRLGYLKLLKLETFQTHVMGGLLYLKLSDETWNEMCYLKLFNLFKPIMRAAYLKLSGETWKRGAIWNFWNLKLFKPIMGGLLIWNFQMRLEKEVLFEMFETWNFSNMSWGVLYLKLSDETWNEMCYLKLFYLFKPITECLFETFRWLEMRCAIWNCLKLETFQPILLIWNFQMRLEVRCAIWNFSTFSNPSWELLIWNFQMRLEKEVLFEIFETWNFSNPSWGGCLFESFRWDLKKRCYLKCLKLETFQTCHGGFFIWNFQMRLEMRCAIWNFSTFSNPSQELLIWNFQMTWNKICYLKCLKLETFQTCHGGCLFETFRWDLKWDVLFETFQSFQPITGVGYLKLSDKTWKRGAIWNFSKFSTHHRSWLFETFR